MTSKDSLAGKRKFCPLLHEILWTARRYWWVSLVGMVLIFGSTYLFMHIEPNNPDVFSIISSDLKVLPRMTAVIYGLFAAFCLFHFLWDRRECIMTLSVGTQRWKQFTLRYIFGIVSAALAVAVPMALAYYLEMRTIGDDPVGLCSNYTFVYGFSLLVVLLLAYTVSVLVAVLCGRFLSALLTVAGVLAAPYALLWGIQRMLDFYLFGTHLGRTLLADHAGAGLFTVLTDCLRWTSYGKFTINHTRDNAVSVSGDTAAWQEHVLMLKEEMQIPVLRVVLLLGLVAILALLAGRAYCRRPAEHAGKSVVHPILSHAVALTTALGIAGFTLMIPSPAEGFAGTALLTALLVLAFVLSAFLIRLLLIWDCKATVRHYAIPCGGAVLCLVISILLGTGWFGYASYVPDAADVVSVRVTYNQNRALFYNLSGGAFSQGYPHGMRQALGGYGVGDEYWHFLYSYGMEPRFESLPLMTEAEDIQKVLSIHEAIVDAGRPSYTGEPAEVHEDTVVTTCYRISYQLKNGKTVERYYHHLSLATLETTVQVEDTYAYRSVFYENHDGVIFGENAIELGDPLFSKFTSISLSEEEQKALLKALDTDVAYLTSEQRYFHTGDPARDPVIGILRCVLTEGNIDKWINPHPFDRNYETYYLTAAYENTLAFLSERGLTELFENPYTVESVRIRPYTPRFYQYDDRALSYVFFSCDNVVQALPEPIDVQMDSYAFYTNLDDLTTAVPEAEWDAYIQNSRALALLTRPGTMVQIILTNADGEQKLVTRYLYDEAATRE